METGEESVEVALRGRHQSRGTEGEVGRKWVTRWRRRGEVRTRRKARSEVRRWGKRLVGVRRRKGIATGCWRRRRRSSPTHVDRRSESRARTSFESSLRTPVATDLVLPLARHVAPPPARPRPTVVVPHGLIRPGKLLAIQVILRESHPIGAGATGEPSASRLAQRTQFALLVAARDGDSDDARTGEIPAGFVDGDVRGEVGDE